MFREAKAEPTGLPDLILWAAVIEDGIVMQWDGSLMATWSYRGPDLQSATHAEMNAVAARLNKVMCLGSGWMIQVDAFRTAANEYAPAGEFPDPVTAVIDEERRAQFHTEGSHFESEYFLTLTYLPPRAAEEGTIGFFIQNPDPRKRDIGREAVDYFKTRVRQFEEVLGSQFPIRRMKAVPHKEPGDFLWCEDEQLAFLRRAMSHERAPVCLPEIPVDLNDHLSCEDFLGGMKPRLGNKHIRVLAIDGLPPASWPGALSAVDSVPYEYRWNTRAILMDPAEAQTQIDKTRRKWNFQKRGMRAQLMKSQSAATNLYAVAMAADAEAAMGEAASGDVYFCYFSANVILLDENEDRLERMLGEFRKALVNRGFGVRVETVNAVDAWLGTMPGNGYENVRRPIVHTRNLADLMPITAVWAGERRNPSKLIQQACGADCPPLVYAATQGGTPFRVNLHYQDVGHTLMVGPTGAGKSTLMSLLAAQFFRYPGAQVFAFDKGYSMYALVRACGGHFYDIGSESPVAFQPLRHIEQPGEFAWACEWVENLLRMQNVRIGPSEKRLIQDAMQLMVDTPIERRTLTVFQVNLQSQDLKDALNPYTVSGSLGALLDADSDSLAESRFVVCEMENLLGGNYPPEAVLAVLSYLFRRMEKRLDGRPTLVPLDEAWLFLRNPVWRDRIQEWLKTLRKSNAVLLLATQSLSDITESEIAPAVLQACYTKIYLPNAEAGNENTSTFYRQAGLNSREITIIQRALPKREYYITQPLGRRLVSFGLGPVALSFVGASGVKERARIDDLYAHYRADWVPEWLSERGVSEKWIQFFTQKEAHYARLVS